MSSTAANGQRALETLRRVGLSAAGHDQVCTSIYADWQTLTRRGRRKGRRIVRHNGSAANPCSSRPTPKGIFAPLLSQAAVYIASTPATSARAKPQALSYPGGDSRSLLERKWGRTTRLLGDLGTNEDAFITRSVLLTSPGTRR